MAHAFITNTVHSSTSIFVNLILMLHMRRCGAVYKVHHA